MTQHSSQNSITSIVSLLTCPSYNQELVSNVIDKSLNNIGGLNKYIKPGYKVLIKPNLLSAKSPDKAVTTHPTIVHAVVEQIQKIGAEVTIGDSPAGISRPIEYYWDITGMKEVADATGAKLIALEKNGVVKCTIEGKNYFISKPVIDADVVLNLCKMKTHGLTLFTGAIKNIFGTIPGVAKGDFHKIAPKIEAFSKILVDIYRAVSPQITIMDAILAMEGDGPTSGNVKKAGFILASTDPVAIDTIAAHIMGFKQNEILTTKIAYEKNVGNNNLDQIKIIGSEINKLNVGNFHLPSNRIINFIPEILLKFIGKFIWIRPKANTQKCKRCELCISNCPVKAMKSKGGLPIINYTHCIKCFCCDETCPHDAIDQKMSWLAQKFM